MESLSLTDARAQLPQLLDRVEGGESFTITRHGAPVAVLVGNAEWMKTRQHDVIIRARELGRRLEAASGKAWVPPVEAGDPLETEEWIADLRAGKGSYPDERED